MLISYFIETENYSVLILPSVEEENVTVVTCGKNLLKNSMFQGKRIYYLHRSKWYHLHLKMVSYLLCPDSNSPLSLHVGIYVNICLIICVSVAWVGNH